jgi:hypothetical protein
MGGVALARSGLLVGLADWSSPMCRYSLNLFDALMRRTRLGADEPER